MTTKLFSRIFTIFMFTLLSACGDSNSSEDKSVIDEKQVFSLKVTGSGQIVRNAEDVKVGDRLEIDLLPDKGYMIDSASGCDGEWLYHKYVVPKRPKVCELVFVFRQVVRENVDNLFKPMQFASNNTTLNYHLYSPPVLQGEHYPLIVALHGTAEGAAAQAGQVNPHLVDNIGEPIGRPLATTWVQEPIREQYPAFVLAPLIKLDENGQWYDDQLTRIVDQAIQSLLETYPIDQDRIYLVGHSVGGMATWTAPAIVNNRFAALLPMSGWFDANNASADLADTIAQAYPSLAIWSFGHIDDLDVPIMSTREIRGEMETQGLHVEVFADLVLSEERRNALQTLKQPLRYFNTEFSQPCVGGGAACHWAGIDGASEEPLMIDWLFRQHRLFPDAIQALSASTNGNGVQVRWDILPEYSSITATLWIFNEQDKQWRQAASEPANERELFISSTLIQNDTRVRMTLRDPEGRIVSIADTQVV